MTAPDQGGDRCHDDQNCQANPDRAVLKDRPTLHSAAIDPASRLGPQTRALAVPGSKPPSARHHRLRALDRAPGPDLQTVMPGSDRALPKPPASRPARVRPAADTAKADV